MDIILEQKFKGFIKELSIEDYHITKDISKSKLDLINRSPKHFLHSKIKLSPQMKFGSAFHTYVLENEIFKKKYQICKSDKRSKEYKDLLSQCDPEFIISQNDFEKIKGMADSLYESPLTKSIFTQKIDTELSLFTKDPETDLNCKCRFDILTSNNLGIDLKKTIDARPESFQKSVYNYRYHVQAAFYDYLFFLETGTHLEAFLFIAIEDQPPYEFNVFILDELSLDLGLKEAKKNLKTIKKAFYENDYFGYSKDIKTLSLPPWAFKEDL